MYTRDKTRRVYAGGVPIGGGAPVSVQSMTNTATTDVNATIRQIEALRDAGADIVRVAVYDGDAAKAFAEIRKSVSVPLVADVHFDYKLAIAALEAGADKLRINPGNMRKDKLREVISCAKERNKPIRVGVNAGSLDRELLQKYGNTADALVESALQSVALLENAGFENIVVSIKASDTKKTFDACMKFAQVSPYPQHIGVTEAGTRELSAIKSAVGLGALLLCGVGDTIRVSMTGDPLPEVRCAKDILKAAGLLHEGVEVVSCPTCGRTKGDVEDLALELAKRLSGVKKPVKIAVMGCEVNGPGEAKEADIGVAFAGEGGLVLFAGGKAVRAIRREEAVDAIMELAGEPGEQLYRLNTK